MRDELADIARDVEEVRELLAVLASKRASDGQARQRAIAPPDTHALSGGGPAGMVAALVCQLDKERAASAKLTAELAASEARATLARQTADQLATLHGKEAATLQAKASTRSATAKTVPTGLEQGMEPLIVSYYRMPAGTAAPHEHKAEAAAAGLAGRTRGLKSQAQPGAKLVDAEPCGELEAEKPAQIPRSVMTVLPGRMTAMLDRLQAAVAEANVLRARVTALETELVAAEEAAAAEKAAARDSHKRLQQEKLGARKAANLARKNVAVGLVPASATLAAQQSVPGDDLRAERIIAALFTRLEAERATGSQLAAELADARRASANHVIEASHMQAEVAVAVAEATSVAEEATSVAAAAAATASKKLADGEAVATHRRKQLIALESQMAVVTAGPQGQGGLELGHAEPGHQMIAALVVRLEMETAAASKAEAAATVSHNKVAAAEETAVGLTAKVADLETHIATAAAAAAAAVSPPAPAELATRPAGTVTTGVTTGVAVSAVEPVPTGMEAIASRVLQLRIERDRAVAAGRGSAHRVQVLLREQRYNEKLITRLRANAAEATQLGRKLAESRSREGALREEMMDAEADNDQLRADLDQRAVGATGGSGAAAENAGSEGSEGSEPPVNLLQTTVERLRAANSELRAERRAAETALRAEQETEVGRLRAEVTASTQAAARRMTALVQQQGLTSIQQQELVVKLQRQLAAANALAEEASEAEAAAQGQAAALASEVSRLRRGSPLSAHAATHTTQPAGVLSPTRCVAERTGELRAVVEGLRALRSSLSPERPRDLLLGGRAVAVHAPQATWLYEQHIEPPHTPAGQGTRSTGDLETPLRWLHNSRLPTNPHIRCNDDVQALRN